MRKRPYSRPMLRVLRWSQGDGRFLMGELPLYIFLGLDCFGLLLLFLK